MSLIVWSRVRKQSPDINISELFDDIEDEHQINKHKNRFIPIEEIPSDEFNPELMFLAREASGFKDEEIDDEVFALFQPNASLDHLLPDGKDYKLYTSSEHELTLSIQKMANMPKHLGIGKQRALAHHF